MMKATKDFVKTFANEADGVKRLSNEQKESYEYSKFHDAQVKRHEKKQENIKKAT